MDKVETLKCFYQENCVFARHHEQLRATITNFIIVVAAALISLVTYDGSFSLTDLPITVFIFFLGVFGAVFSSKHYERIRLHLRRARKYREEIDKMTKGIKLSKLREKANKENEQKYGWLAKVKLNNFWIALHVLISIIGLILSVFSLITLE